MWKGLTSSFSLGRPFNKLVVFHCIHKKNWLRSFKKKKNFSHPVQSAIMHSQSFRGCHNASLLPSPQFSLCDASFLGAQGGDQSLLLPVGVGPDWGPAPEPYLNLWLFLMSLSLPPVSPVSLPVRRVRTPVQNRNRNTIRWRTFLFLSGASVVGNLAGASRYVETRNQAPQSESWRTQVYYAGGPRGVNTPTSES